MLYRIGTVSRMTGLPVDVIRVWERRYKAVEPVRDENGVRLYREDDVARLAQIRRATESGHSVGRVAAMSQDELDALMNGRLQAEASVMHASVARILSGIRNGDPAQVESALSSASMFVDVRTLALEVLAPVLREAGSLWETGTLSVWEEHLLSWLIRNVTGSLMRSLPRGQSGAILFATPPFELHEFGIALAALLAAARGRPTHNLGINVPADEVVRAARRLQPECVVLGLTQKTVPRALALEFVEDLDEMLPRKTALWLGGSLGAEIAQSMRSARVHAVATLEDFDARLAV